VCKTSLLSLPSLPSLQERKTPEKTRAQAQRRCDKSSLQNDRLSLLRKAKAPKGNDDLQRQQRQQRRQQQLTIAGRAF
jgi:hypothetical protein